MRSESEMQPFPESSHSDLLTESLCSAIESGLPNYGYNYTHLVVVK